MATDIHFSARAEDELSEIIDFLGPGTRTAEMFAERFDRGIAQLLAFPQSAPADPFGARLLYLTGTSFSIAYQYLEESLYILAVPHSSSPRGSWMLDEARENPRFRPDDL